MSEGRLLNRERECRVAGFSKQEGRMETQAQQEQMENRISKYFEGNTVSVLLEGIRQAEPRVVERPAMHLRRMTGMPIDELPATRLKPLNPDRIVKLMKQQGVEAKVFCVHSSRKENFVVKSLKWNWHVLPLKKSGTKVPSEILERVALLLEHGARIEKLYVAKPIENSIGKVLAEEVVIQGKALAVELHRLGNGALEAFQEMQRGRNPVPTLLHYLPDPVLLVKLQGYVELVEVGRWL